LGNGGMEEWNGIGCVKKIMDTGTDGVILYLGVVRRYVIPPYYKRMERRFVLICFRNRMGNWY